MKSADSSERGRSQQESSSGKKNGWANYNKRVKETEEEREKREGQLFNFWLKGGESAVIQVLDDVPVPVDGHNIKDKSGNYVFEPCQLAMQKHCLMCQADIRRNWKPALKILDFRGEWDKDKERFKYNKPVEKLWVMSQATMELLKKKMEKKKRDSLKNFVVEVSRTGTGKKNTAYAFEDAFDEKDNRIEPVDWRSSTPSTEDQMAPKSDEELEKLGFKNGNDD